MDSRSRHRLPLVMLGMLFASGRRTVTTWMRAALLQEDFQACYYFLQTVGRSWLEIGDRELELVLERVL